MKMPLRIDQPINVMSSKALSEMAYDMGAKTLESMGLPGDTFTLTTDSMQEKLLTKSNLFKAGQIAFLGVTAGILAKYVYNTHKNQQNALS